MRACGEDVVSALGALGEDWDGYGAAPVSEEALAVVRAMLVVPTCNGGVQVEWRANGWDFEVEISKDGIATSFVMEAAS